MISKLQRTQIFITLILGTFLVAMTVTVTSIMLPSIMQDYMVSTSTAQWLTSGATLVSGIMIPIAAYLIKRFPNKNYFVTAMFLYCIGSLLGILADNFQFLMAGRLIQAIGCGMLMPFSQVILMKVYPKEQHGTVISAYALSSTVAPVVAPTIAGFVIDISSWKMMFLLLFIVGVIILICGFIFMKNVTKTFNEEMQIVPIILSTLGFASLLVGIGNISSQGVMKLKSGGIMLIGIITLGLFVYSQLRAKNTLLNLQIFRIRNFRTAVIISMLMYLICMGSGTLLPVFAQSILGHTASTFALITLPGSVAMAIVTFCAGKMYDKYGAKPLLIGGSIMLISGSILGILFGIESTIWHIGLVSCLLSAGTGFLNAPATTMGLSNMTEKDRVDGSAILNTLRQIASALASTLAVMIYSLISVKQGDINGVKMVYVFYVMIALLTIIIVFYFLKRRHGRENGKG